MSHNSLALTMVGATEVSSLHARLGACALFHCQAVGKFCRDYKSCIVRVGRDCTVCA